MSIALNDLFLPIYLHTARARLTRPLSATIVSKNFVSDYYPKDVNKMYFIDVTTKFANFRVSFGFPLKLVGGLL